MRVNYIIRSITINLTLVGDRCENWSIQVDRDRYPELQEKYAGQDIVVRFGGGSLADHHLLDATGAPVLSMSDVAARILARPEVVGEHIEHLKGYYVPSSHGPLPIESMSCVVVRTSTRLDAVRLDGTNIASAVIEDLTSKGPQRFFHQDGELTLTVERESR